MSFQVTVNRHLCDPYLQESPLEPQELGDWSAAWNATTLFAAPLGEDNAVGIYWSASARRLSLPLVGSIYSRGLRLYQPQALDALGGELDQLEAYWHSGDFDAACHCPVTAAHVRSQLTDRMADLRQAIRVTRENAAVLTVA